MQVLPPVQLARSRVRGAAAREGRAPARPSALPRDRRPGAQWTRAASVATSATLPCAVSAGLPCGAVVGADVLGGPRVRWRFRVRAAPPRSRQARPSRARRAMDPRRPRSRQARPSRARRAMDPRRPRPRQARPSRAQRPKDPRRPRSRQARPSRARRPMDPRRLGRDKRDPPVRRIRRVTMWCRGRGRRPRRPVRPMAFPCTCRAAVGRPAPGLPVSAQKVFLVQCPSLSGGLFCPCTVPFSLPVSPWRPVPPAASPIRSTYT